MLAALCHCNGEAITTNQDDICQLLLEDEDFQCLLIKVEASQRTHFAIIDDPEIIEQNGGEILKIEIEKMYSYFKSIKNMRIYNYFQSMIELISLMCLQRNYKGIHTLEKLYTLDFTMDCFLNENIQYLMRANLAKLLITLHIDKDPIEHITVPVLSRVWHQIAHKQVIFPTSKVKISPTLNKLKNFVVNYFAETEGI